MTGPQAQPVVPANTAWAYGVAEMPGGPALVYVMLSHPCGRAEVFVNPDEADQIAAQLQDMAKQARAVSKRVFVPPSVLLGPGGQPLSFIQNGQQGPSEPLPASPEVLEHESRARHPSNHPEVLEARPEQIVHASEHLEGCVRGNDHPGECVVATATEPLRIQIDQPDEQDNIAADEEPYF